MSSSSNQLKLDTLKSYCVDRGFKPKPKKIKFEYETKPKFKRNGR